MPLEKSTKRGALFVLAGALAIVLIIFSAGLRPVVFSGAFSDERKFSVEQGEGFREIADRLEQEGLVKSASVFKLWALFTGRAGELKPGTYYLSPSMDGAEILARIVLGPYEQVRVAIHEGASVYEIARVLGEQGIVMPNEFIEYVRERGIEGRLFPDTYKFFTSVSPEEAVEKFLDNFEEKTGRLGLSGDDLERTLILASLIEKEVPDHEERVVIAGILEKRLKVGMPLQVDATICYIKIIEAYPEPRKCYPLSTLDFRRGSEYNTYLHRGLPPGPIGNPGLSAIEAATDARESPYWYYLSDPETGRTIFSATLDEHNENRAKYLGL